MAGFDPSNTIPDIIVEESGRLNNIITDFLNFAKPKRPAFAICHVEEILEKNIKYLSAQTKSQGYIIKKHNFIEVFQDMILSWSNVDIYPHYYDCKKQCFVTYDQSYDQ